MSSSYLPQFQFFLSRPSATKHSPPLFLASYSTVSLCPHSSLASTRVSMDVSSLPLLAECFATRFMSSPPPPIRLEFCPSSSLLPLSSTVAPSCLHSLFAHIVRWLFRWRVMCRARSRGASPETWRRPTEAGLRRPACRSARRNSKLLNRTDANALAPSR